MSRQKNPFRAKFKKLSLIRVSAERLPISADQPQIYTAVKMAIMNSVLTAKNRAVYVSQICQNLKLDDKDLISMMRKIRGLNRIKHVFIQSGIRWKLRLNFRVRSRTCR